MTQDGSGLNFQSPEDVAPQKTTVVLYGPAGSGKSTFASTWPGAYFMVPAISSNELKSLHGLGMKNNVLVFETMKEMNSQAVALARAVKAGRLPDCRTFVFDNLTSAQLVAEYELLELTGKSKLTWEEWGKFAKLWKDMLFFMHQLPINIVWITHSEAKEITPPGEGQLPYTEGGPTLVGKSKRFIPGQADMYLYCDSVARSGSPIEFRVYLKQRDIWPARVRGNVEDIDRLPQYIGGLTEDYPSKRISPTYDELAKLMGWKSKAEIEGSKESQRPKRRFKLPARQTA